MAKPLTKQSEKPSLAEATATLATTLRQAAMKSSAGQMKPKSRSSRDHMVPQRAMNDPASSSRSNPELISPSASASKAVQLDIPIEFVCPLSSAVMDYPVITPAGLNFDRAAILVWLESSDVCPITFEPLTEADLLDNSRLRVRIAIWRQSKDIQEHQRIAANQHRIRCGDQILSPRRHNSRGGSTPRRLASWGTASTISALTSAKGKSSQARSSTFRMTLPQMLLFRVASRASAGEAKSTTAHAA